ncbi:MAG: NfeD family protein [Verrucomicrobiota bacterium]
MSWIILLGTLGIVCLLVEVLVPGGILGIIGGGFLLGASVVAFVVFGFATGTAVLVGSLALAGLAFWLEVRILPRTPLGKRAILNEAIDAVSAQFGPDAAALVGSPATAITMLSPSGYVSVNGTRYEAFSRDGQLPVDTALIVVAADSFRLIVSKSNSS